MTTNKMTTGIIIGLVIIAVLALRLFRKQPIAQQASTNASITSTADQTIPDAAISFGYKCMWFAVKTNDQQKLAELLKIKNTSTYNWKVGIDKAYESSVFITPAIDGWTLACGRGLPTGDSKEGISEVKQILQT